MSKEEIYRSQNLGNALGFGRKAGLLVVDFVNGFNDADILGGGNISAAIAQTRGLLDRVRSLGLPVAFTRIVYQPGANPSAFSQKVPTLLTLSEDNPASHVVPELAPQPNEYIIRKTQASGFFGTDLAAWLQWRDVDTVLVTGCTTSGCVRASVVDAISYNFRPIVVRDCVGDRALEPHEASLFDMQQKYADVLDKEQVLRRLT